MDLPVLTVLPTAAPAPAATPGPKPPWLKMRLPTGPTVDDLPDLGAGHYAATIRALKATRAALLVEALTPDFQGRDACVNEIVDAGVDVFAHNIETVERLHRRVRDARATYAQTLHVLRAA